MSPIKTHCEELLTRIMAGLQHELRAIYKNDKPDPRLKSTSTELVLQYKGDFYKITVELCEPR